MTELLVKLFIKNSADVKDRNVRLSYGNLGAITGIVCNLLLCIAKIAAGAIIGSMSVIADGLNNLSDMGSSLISMIGFRLSNKPADADHPFGHGRMEYLSAFTVSILILIVGAELMINSVKAIASGATAPRFSYPALCILWLSILVKLWMFLFNFKLGRRINSSTLIATARDSLNDCISTLAILVCAIVSMNVSLSFNLDAVVSIGVAAFILWSGISTLKDTIGELLGRPPEPELINDIERGIMAFDGFLGVHDLIVHNYGHGRQFASVHVEVPQDTDIVKCHEQIDICEKVVGEKCGISLVIHMDPVNVNDESVNSAKAAMVEVIKSIHEDLTLHDFRMTPPSDERTNLIFDVVVPNSVKLTETELDTEIKKRAKQIDKTYECVITYDKSFV
ncbi:MAG: cation transporter [Clostridia bacterium]|nr:cation transporter [Clostridia bacterium]